MMKINDDRMNDDRKFNDKMNDFLYKKVDNHAHLLLKICPKYGYMPF